MKIEEYDRLLAIAGKVQQSKGDDAALAVLTANGIPEVFARLKLNRLAGTQRLTETVPSPLTKLLPVKQPKQQRSSRRNCLIIGPVERSVGRLKPEEKEVAYLLNHIVRPALERLPFKRFWGEVYKEGQEGLEQAFAAINSAQLVVAVLSPTNVETYQQLGIAQAYGTPILSLAAEGMNLPPGIDRSKAIFYSEYSPRRGLKLPMRKMIISEMRERALEIGAGSPRRDRRFVEFGSCSTLESIYNGKDYALSQFWLDLAKISDEMNCDYELVSQKNPDALIPIAKLLGNSAVTFSQQCKCLHEVAEPALQLAPKAEANACKAICAAMDAISSEACAWVNTVQQVPPKESDIPEAGELIAKIAKKITECRIKIRSRQRILQTHL